VADRHAPGSTYRLQLTSDFGFDAAAELAGYLADLGITHVYLSPILQAVPGSRHGYDVVDHSRVSADLGGEDAFRAMVRRFHEHRLGVVVDVVPNHMALSPPESLNSQLWSVLAEGTQSRYAHWFDIDWAAQDGRFLLPILAGPPEQCLADFTIDAGSTIDARSTVDVGSVIDDGPVLRYHEHVLPVRAGTEQLPLSELLDAQHYRLADWREASTALNWRRFFDITTLIAIKVEDPAVFADTHEVLFRLLAEGLIDGLRIDHPDGLANPREYLDRLAEATGGAWVVVEKILERGEQLPADWKCAGTTGYDALALVNGLFIDPAGAAPLTAMLVPPSAATPSAVPASPSSFAAVAEVAKREVTLGSFTPEVSRLSRLLDADPVDLHTVLVEILAAFGVYRAYVIPGEKPSEASVRAVTEAASQARRVVPERLRTLVDAVRDAALDGPEGMDELDGPDEFVVRFQQTTGPVLAKGVEDTACYRWSRLVSLNEVGNDPDQFGWSQAEFHAAAEHLASEWPATMTTQSTHDTKRQEDVRARLAVLAERPDEWASEVAAWQELAAVQDSGPGGDFEQLIWQTLVGAWPISADRLSEYLTKAMREAKTHTSWTEPDQEYEAAVLDFGKNALADPKLAGRIGAFVDQIAPDARVNSLGAKLVQLTMPGVPDVYQGCELTGFALVDPDNRRPVDFERRRRLLAQLDQPENTHLTGLDEEKLLVTSRALRLRREHPGWFSGGYTPLTAEGPAAGNVIAFRRGAAVTIATRLPAGLRQRGGWGDTTLELPALQLPGGDWHDVLTGAKHAGGTHLLAALTHRLPVALLVAQ
jgi:(1->4)-alpha-D-glucan 1-alpha-D-glucosylmutase